MVPNRVVLWLMACGVMFVLLPTGAFGIDLLDMANCFDFIVLAHDSLATGATPCLSDPDLRSCLVRTSEVLDAFGEDSLTVHNVRDFVEYAYLNWRIAPTYLLLIGDEYVGVDHDPPQFFGYIPSYPCSADWYTMGWSELFVDDGWIVSSESLGSKPLMHVGRIPARKLPELSVYAGKLSYYKYEDWSGFNWVNDVLFLVGDRTSGSSEPGCQYSDYPVMRTFAESLIDDHLSGWNDVSVMYSTDYDCESLSTQGTQALTDAWNPGLGLIYSFGNTANTCWFSFLAEGFCGPGPTFTCYLTNLEKYPVILSGSCFVNYFYRTAPSVEGHPNCVAEDALLRSSGKGAVASYGSCHITPVFENYVMSDILLDLFVSKGIRDLGQISSAARVEYLRQGLGRPAAARQFCLLGDPTIQIKVPVECHSEDYWVTGRYGAEIEESRVLQETYCGDPLFVAHPNLRIVHDDGNVNAACGERMIRATARDEYGLGNVEWKLADTQVICERNSILSFWINIVESPGNADRVCVDGVLSSDWKLSDFSENDGIYDQYGNSLAYSSRTPLPDGWHLLYADLSTVASDPYQPWDLLQSLTLHYRAEFGGGEAGSLLVYLDDVQVRPTNAWRGEVLNPDVEDDANGDGKPDFWTNLDGEYGDEVTLSSDFAYSGLHSMRVSNPTEQGARQIVHLNHDISRYWFSFVVKANLQTQVDYCVRRVDTGDTLCGWYGTVNREWRKLGCILNNPWYTGSSYGVSLISVEISPPAGGIVYVDSVTVTPFLSGTVEGESGAIPRRTDLTVAPNPANPTCEIQFQLARGGEVSLVIYDVNGRVISVLAEARIGRGAHQRVWDGRDTNGIPVASGIYFCRLKEGKRAITKKIVVVR